jgi:hypothetical protein
MSERRNTAVCTFDPTGPNISAFDIHEWINDTLRILEQEVTVIQMDGPKRQVYIKMEDIRRVNEVLQGTNGQAEYKNNNGTITIVKLGIAGMGTKVIRVAN